MHESFHRPAAENNRELKRETILVIDDDADVLLLNKTILEMEDYQVFTAQSGSEAFALLKEISSPNLILLDMKMGDMTGLDFLALLEQQRPDILSSVPVVFLTGVGSVPKCKAVGFIRKPIEISHFLKAIHHFIDTTYDSSVKH
jgi:CheY-like chemotaxis protein